MAKNSPNGFKRSDLIGRRLVRDFLLTKEVAVVDRVKRTVQVVLSSDEPILHVIGDRTIAYVILDHKPSSINLTRVNAGGSRVLENHDPKQPLGFQRSPETNGKLLRMEWWFGSRARQLEIFNETADAVDEGFSPGASIGFEINRVAPKPEGSIEGIPIIRATEWTVVEGTLAWAERDLRAGVGRCLDDSERGAPNDDEQENEDSAEEATESDEEEAAEEGDEVENTGAKRSRSKSAIHVRTNTMTEAERLAAEAANRATNPLVVLETRTNDFVKFATIFGNTDAQRSTLTEMAREFALTGKSEDDLKAEIQKTRTSWAADAPSAMPKLTEAETRRYSITRAILADASMRDKAVGGDTQCFELDVSQELEKRVSAMGTKLHGGIFMPTSMALRGKQMDMGLISLLRNMPGGPELLKRAGLDTLTDTKGQELVFTEAGSFIDLLRKKAMVVQMGATVLAGLQGNVAFPKQIGAGTFSWVGENPGSDVADSNLTLDQVLLSPKTGMSSTSYSRQLLRQSVIDIDGLVMSDLAKINALGIDLAALHGLGSANQPRGIYNTSGIGSVTFGGAITFAKVVDMETAVAGVDADIGTMGYLTTPNVRGKAKQTLVAAAAGSAMIWQNGEMNGYRAEATNQILKTLGSGSDHGMLFGVWSELMIGEWGALEIITDPYRLKKQGMIEVTSFIMVDVAPRYPEAFVKAVTLVP